MPIALTPDVALIVFTLGILLIYLEFNRPGWIVPGALGLLTVLLTAPKLNGGIFSLAAAGVVLATNLWALRHSIPRWLSLPLTTIALLFCFVLLPQVHLWTSIPCGILLGSITSNLVGVARRARTAKGLD